MAKIGAQGRLTEVYADRIVYIDTLLASVTNVTNATFDAAGHLRTPATITLAVYDTNTTASAGGYLGRTNLPQETLDFRPL